MVAARGTAAFEDALQRLGAKRVEATLLSAIMRRPALGTKDIVESTGLRQPEVSVGMQTLRERGWVEAEAITREGKGRPMHRYRLVVRPAEIRRYYEEEAKATIADLRDAVRVLKEHLG